MKTVVLILDYTMMDIRSQMNSMIYLNIMSYSVLSGCGNCSMPNLKEIEEMEPILQALPHDKRPYNIFFTNSLYKKCMPQYQEDIENPYNFSSFKWIEKKRKKTIDIEVMANSIICCCNLIERLLTFDVQLENLNFIIYILHKTATNQARFIKRYLKIGNMFYHGEDVAKLESEDLHIQITADKTDSISQFAVLHATAALIQLSNYDLCFFNYPVEELIEDISILPDLLHRYMEGLEEYSSKELSNIGLHIAEIYKKSEFHTDACRKALHKIGKELCHRTKSTGEIQRRKDIEETASPSTTASCLNLLSQLAYMFSSKSSYEASQMIYQNLLVLWDKESRIFKLNSGNKQRFNLKDLSSIVAALFSYSKILQEPDLRNELYRQIVEFSETTLVRSCLFNGQCYPILQQNKMKLHDSQECDSPWAPVFNKVFEYKLSKKKYYCDADVFRADYVLPACALLLNCINN
jgi:hypothetical protein